MKTLITLFLTALTGVVIAQTIPNGNFESWSGSPLTPTGWYTSDALLANSALQSSDAISGNFSLELESALAGSTYLGGLAGTGTSLTNGYFVCGSTPLALNGWYQLDAVGGDELVIVVKTRDASSVNGGALDTIKVNTPPNVWKQFSACISAIGATDSAQIILELENKRGHDTTNNGSNTLIDSLTFGACGVAGVEDINNNVTLEPSYPNPANDICNIIFSIPGTSLVNADLYDINGRKVLNLMNNANLSSGRYKIPVDVHKLANGVYFYTITVDGVPYTQKLVIAK